MTILGTIILALIVALIWAMKRGLEHEARNDLRHWHRHEAMRRDDIGPWGGDVYGELHRKLKNDLQE
ncbi:MAG: hypothetical protein E6Q97_05405 [Desulfurellales bacterium]|nr:MAG: hypothetical protein E6Q97_05405 [Desulfurellales bacterium]